MKKTVMSTTMICAIVLTGVFGVAHAGERLYTYDDHIGSYIPYVEIDDDQKLGLVSDEDGGSDIVVTCNSTSEDQPCEDFASGCELFGGGGSSEPGGGESCTFNDEKELELVGNEEVIEDWICESVDQNGVGHNCTLVVKVIEDTSDDSKQLGLVRNRFSK